MTRDNAWHFMSWVALRDAATRKPVVLVPAGTVETQGPYNFVGEEFYLAERLAEDAAKETDALVVPTIPYGWSPDFESYAGTISLRPSVLAQVYEDVGRSIVRHGFDHVMFIVSHINNIPPVEEAAYRVRQDTGVQIAWINPGALATQVWKDIGPDFPVGKGHGADTGLSLGAYLAPDSVDLTGAKANDAQGDYGTLPFGLPHLLEDFSPVIGGFGDATHASAERGALWYAEVLARIVAAIRAYHEREVIRLPQQRSASGAA